MLRIAWFGEKIDQKNILNIFSPPPRHVRRKISAGVDGGTSGPSSVRRRGARTPIGASGIKTSCQWDMEANFYLISPALSDLVCPCEYCSTRILSGWTGYTKCLHRMSASVTETQALQKHPEETAWDRCCVQSRPSWPTLGSQAGRPSLVVE